RMVTVFEPIRSVPPPTIFTVYAPLSTTWGALRHLAARQRDSQGTVCPAGGGHKLLLTTLSSPNATRMSPICSARNGDRAHVVVDIITASDFHTIRSRTVLAAASDEYQLTSRFLTNRCTAQAGRSGPRRHFNLDLDFRNDHRDFPLLI